MSKNTQLGNLVNGIYVSSSGNSVGVKTTTPRATLDVNGNIYSNDIWIADTYGILFGNLTTGTSYAYIAGIGATGASSYLSFSTNAGEKMRIDNNGKVGIGTSSPDSKLNITGGSTRGLRIDTDSGVQGFSMSPNSIFGIDEPGVGNGRFVINTNGRVGIGTSSPGELLHLSKATYPLIKLTETTANTSGQFGYDSPTAEWRLRTLTSTPLTFGTNDTERVRITSAGLVGIGTASPGSLLDVQGGTNSGFTASIMANSTFAFGSTNGRRLVVLTSTQGDKNGLQIGYDSTAGTGIIAAATESAGAGLDFYTYNGSAWASRMRITSAGNISFGSTTASQSEINNNHNAVGQGLYWGTANNTSYADWIFNAKCERTNSSSYGFFRSISGGGDIEHLLRGDGNAYADASWNGGGADYAEYFEWEDGNINNETRTGMSVSLSNGKIKVAENNEVVIGVVSANPSMVGDTAFNKWEGKYLKDEFNSYLRDENGERILNPLFDESQEYIPREQRKEWAVIGLVGKLRIKKGQKIGSSWIKIKDISSEVEEWLIK